MIEHKIWAAILPAINGFTEAGVDVVLPDTVYRSTATQPYIFINPVWFPYDAGGLSFECGNETRGWINFSVRVPVGWTYTQHIALASRFMSVLPYGSQHTYDDVTAQVYEKPALNAAAFLDGPLNRIDGSIPIRAWG